MLTVCCGEKANNCPRREGCLTRKAWVQVSRSLERELDSITLSALVHGDQICPENQDELHVPAQSESANEKIKKAGTPKGRVITRKVKGLRR